MPLPALGELPQLTALSLAWRRLIDVKPVLMAVNNTSLVCCWDQSGRWQQRVVGWPDGVCRDGVPLQREAVGELIADLIFDCDCPGAELVLCLPLQAASWCEVDGYGADGSPDLLPLLGSLFRSRDSTRLKDELVILVTPRVLDDDQGGVFGYGYQPATKSATQLMRSGF